MVAQPSAFPQDLPERPRGAGGGGGGSWKDRNCPNMRNCWSFSISSYSLKTSEKAVLARRICMLTILAIRTVISILSIIGNAWGGRIASVIIGSILAVLGFFFIAWCLAKIGEAQGYRKVLGMNIGRWHFDVFLLVVAVVHVPMLIGWFFGFRGAGLSGTWILMWLIIFGAAWIATWEPEQPAAGSYV